MTERKTIQINPELFKLNNNLDKKKNKTIKNKPLISLNNLKNKFLNKIKENKNNEIKLSPFLNKKYEKKKLDDIKLKDNNNIETDSSKDEFTESLEYLKKLSEKNKQNSNNSLINKNNENNENNKTLKNNISVNIELPVELKEKNSFVFETKNDKNKSCKMKYKIDNDVPFGCLKNGIKPCFRSWKTLKNYPLIYENENENKNENEYENEDEDKLKIINKKINNNLIQEQQVFHQLNQRQPVYNQLSQQSQYNQPLHQQPFQQPFQQSVFQEPLQESLYQKPILNKIQENKKDFIIEKLEEHGEVRQPEEIIKKEVAEIKEIIKKDINVPVKQIIKKTTYKKYTLGKNNLKRKVGVLIKNNKTRKNIMEQHKLLKIKPIPEVKKYLREHNLIKSGSYCPNDVLRKMYESAILTGEIINIDKDMMIHNIINNEDRL